MKQPNIPIISAASIAVDANSNPIPMEQEEMCAIQAVWTGTPVGNFTIEVSCDDGALTPSGVPTGITNWSTYTGSTVAAGGADGDFTWLIADLPVKWIRLKYTHTSGTGTLNARLNGKGD